VIIPVYNGENYLNYSLSSVLNQRMKEIEIIIINDNSNDNSSKVIHKYMEKDKRIKLIENNVNRKIFYSKSIGALNSKGKYIIELDQDDMFISDKAFDIIYNESEKYNLDLLSFGFISGKNIFKKLTEKKCKYKKNNIIIENQPKIKYSMFKTITGLLWGHLIKADLYKKILYHLWPIIINYKIIFQEDYLILFFIAIYAKNHTKIVDKLLFHFINNKSASDKYENNLEYYLSLIFSGHIFYDYYIDYYSYDIQILMNYIYFLSKHFKEAQKYYPSLLNFLFRKIISNNDLALKTKKKLIKFFKIQENYDSYNYRNIKPDNSQYSNEALIKKTDIPKLDNNSIALSIIIICSIKDKIINAIKTLTNQNLENFEIILIYDDNNKKEYNLIKNYTSSYKNIKLIYNKRKKGMLRSISEGAMITKGKYLIIFDINCFFQNNDTLNNIYKEIEKENADILEFNLYNIFPNGYSYLYRCNHYKSRFNLTKIKYNLLFKEIDIKKDLLTNKLIKSEYFKNIIKAYKFNKIKIPIDNYYNDIFDFVFRSSFHKFRHIESNEIFKNETYHDKINFNDFIKEQKLMIRETIFYINFIYDNSKNTFESKEKILLEFFNVLNIIFNKFTNITNSSLKLLSKFKDCKYISRENKKLLIFYYNSLIN
jgi:glycosyltransferase involved in cell wall biosynthesis